MARKIKKEEEIPMSVVEESSEVVEETIEAPILEEEKPAEEPVVSFKPVFAPEEIKLEVDVSKLVPEEEIEDNYREMPSPAEMHAYLTELRKKVNNETATPEEVENHDKLSHMLQR